MFTKSGAAAAAADGRMPLVEHLTELRHRVIVCAIAVTLGAVVAFALYNRILDILQQPYCEVTDGRQCSFLALSPTEGFTTRLQIAGYGGVVLALPVLLWQLWRFVTPALHRNERRYAIPFIVSSLVLFAIGGALAYYTFPRALDFLLTIGGDSIETYPSPSKYLGLISLMIMAFGFSFEFPVLLVFLQLVGVVSSARLRRWRRPAIVVIVVFCALITPSQDPYTLLAMAAPMYLFYEGSIAVGRLLKK